LANRIDGIEQFLASKLVQDRRKGLALQIGLGKNLLEFFLIDEGWQSARIHKLPRK